MMTHNNISGKTTAFFIPDQKQIMLTNRGDK